MQDHYNRDDFGIILPAVLNYISDKAKENIPEEGAFQKFGIRFSCPDNAYTGIFWAEGKAEPGKRVVTVSVYREGTDRLISNYFFFSSTQELMDWLCAEKTVAELTETCVHLRERASRQD